MNRDKMIRKQVYLESKQNEKVKLLSALRGKTEAQIIREAVDSYVTEGDLYPNDPLVGLIGMVNSNDKYGSTAHDRDIYGFGEEER